jgi:hypothetical protein
VKENNQQAVEFYVTRLEVFGAGGLEIMGVSNKMPAASFLGHNLKGLFCLLL